MRWSLGKERPVPFAPLKLGESYPFFAAEAGPEDQCVLSEDQNPEDNQYTVEFFWEACFRVLYWNAPRNEAIRRRRQAHSLLGANGHIERTNAWTHVIGALLFGVFAFLRPFLPQLDSWTLSGQLAAVSAASIVVTFSISTLYHVYSSVRALGPAFRVLDHGIILIALALAAACDGAICTLDYAGVSWQTVVEPFLLAATLLVFFTYRRVVLDPSFTELAWGDCKIGLFRYQHSDGDASPLRTTGYMGIGLNFVLLVPTSYATLGVTHATILLISNAIGLGILTGGLVLDNVFVVPDAWYQNLRLAQTPQRRPQDLWFHNRTCGCVCTAHAWWHVFALVAVLVQLVGREYVLSERLASIVN